jgi:hypothetical protein
VAVASYKSEGSKKLNTFMRHFWELTKNEFLKNDFKPKKTMFSDRKDERKDRETFLATCDTVTRTSLHLSQYLNLHKDFDTSTRLLLWVDKLHLFQLFLIDQLHAYLRAAQPRELSAEDRTKVDATHIAIDTASTSLVNGVTEVSRDVAMSLKNTARATDETITKIATTTESLISKVNAMGKTIESLTETSWDHGKQINVSNGHICELVKAIKELQGRCNSLEDVATTTSTTLNLMDKVQADDRSRVTKVADLVDAVASNSKRDAEIATGSVVRLAERLDRVDLAVMEKLQQIERRISDLEASSSNKTGPTGPTGPMGPMGGPMGPMGGPMGPMGPSSDKSSEADGDPEVRATIDDLTRQVTDLKRDLRDLRENRGNQENPDNRSGSRSRSPPRRIQRVSRLARPFRRWDRPVDPTMDSDIKPKPLRELRVNYRQNHFRGVPEDSSDSDESKDIPNLTIPSQFQFWHPNEAAKPAISSTAMDDMPKLIPIGRLDRLTESAAQSENPLFIPPPPPPPPPRRRDRNVLRKPLLGRSSDSVSTKPNRLGFDTETLIPPSKESFFYSTTWVPGKINKVDTVATPATPIDVPPINIAVGQATGEILLESPTTLLSDSTRRLIDSPPIDEDKPASESPSNPFRPPSPLSPSQYHEVIRIEPLTNVVVEP